MMKNAKLFTDVYKAIEAMDGNPVNYYDNLAFKSKSNPLLEFTHINSVLGLSDEIINYVMFESDYVVFKSIPYNFEAEELILKQKRHTVKVKLISQLANRSNKFKPGELDGDYNMYTVTGFPDVYLCDNSGYNVGYLIEALNLYEVIKKLPMGTISKLLEEKLSE